MKTIVALLVGTLASVAYGQFAISTGVATGGNVGGTLCNKQIDCRPNQECRMYDHYNYPAIWPPCSHTGFCICKSGFVIVSNGSCVPFVNRNLGELCSNQVWEVIRTPEQRCDGSRVICNTPRYVNTNGFCQLVPQPTFAPVPIVTGVRPVVCPTVSWLAACDTTRACCDASRGLTCQTRGPGQQYQQCLCAIKTHIFDQQIGYCRPRIYGDLCTENEDCGSGLISNTGFECRYGRCRCQQGYEPHDNLYWNETSRTTYMRRICISSGAVSWAPTGTACTVYPEQFASANSTRVCHPRAFCHLCFGQRSSENEAGYSSTTALTGTCREYTCQQDGECGFQGSCNRWNGFVDPPCDRGMCDCRARNGFFKDRFSRCAPMRQLWLGDRCLVSSNGLHPWYANNENWDQDKTCVPDDNRIGGYAGYTWGTIKCKLPLIEDADGNCVRNDNMQGILYNVVGYNQACDDADLRLPRTICDITKGLVCRNKICQCPTSTSCSSSYAGCSVTASTTTLIWDGNTCRARGYGDQCSSSNDCCGGQCFQGQCTCPQGTTALDIGTTTINNGGDVAKNAIVSNTKYCFRNYSMVQKGQECHLDPATWNCGNLRYGWNPNNFSPALVCAPGLVCLRCPADYNTDDEARGICRSITPLQLPAGSCGQAELTQQTARGQTSWNGWSRSAASRFDASFLAAVVMMAFAKLF